jgi:hypothetical protein
VPTLRVLRERLATEIYGRHTQRLLSLRERLRGSIRTPVWVGAAAVVVVVVASLSVLRRAPQEETIILRGSAETSPKMFRGEATATVREQGGPSEVVFRWSAQAGADAYRLELYAADLSSLGKFDTGGDTTWTWTAPEVIPFTTTALLWRVIALEQGDEIARSGIQTVALGAR